ncbi:MBL fold metallo-hydrolase [Dysosmobacter sp.]
MTTVHTLASGSSGNAVLISCGSTHLLLDAGISCRRITAALREVGLAPDELTAILITHTHSDHIAGLQTLLKRSRLPIYASTAAAEDLVFRLPACMDHLRAFSIGQALCLGNCSVTAFPTSHDAPGACGYRIDTPESSVGLLTDTGRVTSEAFDLLPGVDLAVVEANHDVETLRSGPYPACLKRRILSSAGHLSNEDAARFAVTLAQSGTSEVILAHLSRENNTPAMAQNAVDTALSAAGLSPRLSVAPRDHLSAAHAAARRSVCRK